MQDSEDRIISVNIEEEMKTAYIDYSMSVIVSRALPDVRDGFKPVHRRVLFSMNELGNTYNNPTKKSARIVGDVMGKYHPHGDSSIYGTLVRLAQPWALRYPLVDGQGNFGNIDGDAPAAMRYTEARLSRVAEEMLRDLKKDTVDWQLNFDDTLKEPKVLPTRLPNLLVNGATGIAVGMTTNMPPHNLREVCDGIVAYVRSKGEITVDELMHYIKAPDFPTGGTIRGIAGVKEAYQTGRGRIVVRSKTDVEVGSGNELDKIIIKEIPYNIVKSALVKHITELVKEKKVEGIAEIRDETNREGIRVVIEVKRDANANVVLNKLLKLTDLQSSFSVINIALVDGRPKLLNLKDLVERFVKHRHEVIYRRTKWELGDAERRAHLLEGFLIILDHIDEAIQIIRSSKTPEEARTRLMERFGLSEVQATAVVEMRLRQLTGMEQDKLRAEYEDLLKTIGRLKEILGSEDLQMQIVVDETLELKEKYGDERRTEIELADGEFNPEDMYADDEMVITISHLGYIKRTPVTEFRTQSRGGVGSKGGNARDEDFIEHIYSATMHNTMMFFTQKGRCYWLKVYEIPEGAKATKGRAIQNLLNIESDDKVNAVLNVRGLNDPAYTESHYLIFCTKQGVVKKTSLSAYARPRQNGVNAITIREDDKVIQVEITDGDSEIILANRGGRAIRFHESHVREMGRTATGVRGMTLDETGDDEIIGMICVGKEDKGTILVVSQQGYGKRSLLDDENGDPIYRITNRGGKGVRTLNVTEKTGSLVAIKWVTDENDLMIINRSGIVLRLDVATLRVMGRATQGVKLIDLNKRGDVIASVCVVQSEPDEPQEDVDETVEDADVADIADAAETSDNTEIEE